MLLLMISHEHRLSRLASVPFTIMYHDCTKCPGISVHTQGSWKPLPKFLKACSVCRIRFCYTAPLAALKVLAKLQIVGVVDVYTP
jgi:hypothetical protein